MSPFHDSICVVGGSGVVWGFLGGGGWNKFANCYISCTLSKFCIKEQINSKFSFYYVAFKPSLKDIPKKYSGNGSILNN